MAGLARTCWDWEDLDTLEEARDLNTAQQAAMAASLPSQRTSTPGASDLPPPLDPGSPARSPRFVEPALSPAHNGSPLADWGGTPRRGPNLGLGADDDLAGPAQVAFLEDPEPESHLDAASGGVAGPRSAAPGTWVNEGNIWLICPARTCGNVNIFYYWQRILADIARRASRELSQ